jgi:hypothetical protein
VPVPATASSEIYPLFAWLPWLVIKDQPFCTPCLQLIITQALRGVFFSLDVFCFPVIKPALCRL